MRHLIERLGFLLPAFIIGVLAAGASGYLTKAEMLLAKAYPYTVFTASTRGCGCGYVQFYSILDGRYLREGRSWSNCDDTGKRVETLIAGASKIIERRTVWNKSGEQMERVMFLYDEENTGEERAEILQYNEKGMSFIDAPALEIALGFEESDIYNPVH